MAFQSIFFEAAAAKIELNEVPKNPLVMSFNRLSLVLNVFYK
jgi:hypothetical protein